MGRPRKETKIQLPTTGVKKIILTKSGFIDKGKLFEINKPYELNSKLKTIINDLKLQYKEL